MVNDRAVIISYVHSFWQDLSVGTKSFDLTLRFGLLFKNFSIGYIFWIVSVKALMISFVYSLWQDLSIGTKMVDLLTLKFDPLF
jgi:hypothetical protein